MATRRDEAGANEAGVTPSFFVTLQPNERASLNFCRVSAPKERTMIAQGNALGKAA